MTPDVIIMRPFEISLILGEMSYRSKIAQDSGLWGDNIITKQKIIEDYEKSYKQFKLIYPNINYPHITEEKSMTTTTPAKITTHTKIDGIDVTDISVDGLLNRISVESIKLADLNRMELNSKMVESRINQLKANIKWMTELLDEKSGEYISPEHTFKAEAKRQEKENSPCDGYPPDPSLTD